MRRISACNISVIESGKPSWECGLLANHRGDCVPAARYSQPPAYPATTPAPIAERLNEDESELNADMKIVYTWLLIVTGVVIIFGFVTLYTAYSTYQILHPY